MFQSRLDTVTEAYSGPNQRSKTKLYPEKSSWLRAANHFRKKLRHRSCEKNDTSYPLIGTRTCAS